MSLKDWKKKTIVYEVYIQSFKDSNNDGIGDINGLESKLDYIKELGANSIWITPIFKSPLVDNGYDIEDYESINSIYGTMSDFEKLLISAHKKNLKIILDLVVNHTSDKHKWFLESKKSKNNQYSDYYIWRDPKPDGTEPSNLGSAFGGSAWTYVAERKQYYLHLFSEQQPDLNWNNVKVRQSIYHMMKFWLDKGVDGFRMDSISLISKPEKFDNVPLENHQRYGAYYYNISNGPHIHEYLQEMNSEVLSKYNIITIGETPHTTPEEAKKYVDPYRNELDMVFQFEHMHVDYGKFGRYSDVMYKLNDLRCAMNKWQEKLSWNTNYLGNHDQPRIVSRFGNDDKYRIKSAKVLAMMYILQKGTPFIFEGEEIGMTNLHITNINELKDIEAHYNYNFFIDKQISPEKALEMVNRKTRDNARTPMQWNFDRNSGFSDVKPWFDVNSNYKSINVKKDLQSSDSIYRFYQKLLQLRKEDSIMIDGEFRPLYINDSEIYAFIRELSGHKKLIVCSLCAYNKKFEVPKNVGNISKVILSNYEKDININDRTIYLKPYEGVVVSLD
ncbi:alpha-glucosidase [Lactobacillus iners]|jgi:oligo-1,6-glucosidase|uniref:Alpha amylase, catalytic domain protein n=1 Tax=Lactobacillus iners DSM 13335 TaxID=525328 RepID=C8PCT0_9LACO|nr:alpha-glucosidase [Lactobacillus iners]EEW51738.1 alpha amylase, catalytic domain protein [Lactobacillus iners DSM 13335]EFQ50650.1 alpha amylase, catalytic domain protein [Lactobacillus iners LEAF 2062A-h1]KRL59703.1 oligo-1,6-glucosidase [Lactobacillus iners DSM 13335]MCT7739463.1 alpha-glucosidase [Lactobacillus iners]MCT7755037.1 alpha-glucosidase [Lactobacillus iners]